MLLTHEYLEGSNNPDGRGAYTSGDGNTLYKNVVETNPNVFLVLGGHKHGVGINVKEGVGAEIGAKHNVVELLADYQNYTVPAGEVFADLVDSDGNIDLNGDGVTDRKATDPMYLGSSFLRLLQFDVNRSEMSVDTYSPYLDNFGATEYDADQHGYNGAEDNFTVPVDLTSRKTSFGVCCRNR